MRDISNDTNHWRNGLHFYWNNDMGILWPSNKVLVSDYCGIGTFIIWLLLLCEDY